MSLFDDPKKVRNYKRAGIGLVVGPFLLTLVYGAYAAPKGEGVLSSMAAALTAVAPFALGALAGFLFGIPRTLTGDTPTPTPAPGGGQDENAAGRKKVKHQVNTNLEQISDWLTKILVGVGLTQLNKIPAEIQSVAEFVAASIGDHGGSDGATAVASAILLYFAVAGFLAGYLVTRLVLAPAFQETENGPDGGAVTRIKAAPMSPTGMTSTSISERDAAELLRFNFDELKTPDEQLAWGKAKLHIGDPNAAVRALGRVVERDPADRDAIENLVFAALYEDPPHGFERAIRAAAEYIKRTKKLTDKDADLLAYHATALGQAYAWEKKHPSGRDLGELRDEALAAIKRALELDPGWKSRFRMFANPKPGATDDDFAELAKDAPEPMKALLS
jgi:tetratricopeptide (TPR) repeat protein